MDWHSMRTVYSIHLHQCDIAFFIHINTPKIKYNLMKFVELQAAWFAVTCFDMNWHVFGGRAQIVEIVLSYIDNSKQFRCMRLYLYL